MLPSAPDELFAGVFSDVAYHMEFFPQTSRVFLGGAAGLMPGGPPGPPGHIGFFIPAASYPDSVPPIETVRTFFPETWIWDLVEVGWASVIKTFYGHLFVFECIFGPIDKTCSQECFSFTFCCLYAHINCMTIYYWHCSSKQFFKFKKYTLIKGDNRSFLSFLGCLWHIL